jgi:hypothetical protein
MWGRGPESYPALLSEIFRQATPFGLRVARSKMRDQIEPVCPGVPLIATVYARRNPLAIASQCEQITRTVTNHSCWSITSPRISSPSRRQHISIDDLQFRQPDQPVPTAHVDLSPDRDAGGMVAVQP